MDKPVRMRVFDCTDGRRRHVGTVFLDEWLGYVIGRLPAREIEQIRRDLNATGKSMARDGLGHQYEYEIIEGMAR